MLRLLARFSLFDSMQRRMRARSREGVLLHATSRRFGWRSSGPPSARASSETRLSLAFAPMAAGCGGGGVAVNHRQRGRRKVDVLCLRQAAARQRPGPAHPQEQSQRDPAGRKSDNYPQIKSHGTLFVQCPPPVLGYFAQTLVKCCRRIARRLVGQDASEPWP